MESLEKSLPAFVAELDRALDSLVEPKTRIISLPNGETVTVTKQSLLDEMQDDNNFTGQKVEGLGRAAYGSKPPLRLDFMDWWNEVARQSKVWINSAGTTRQRLEALAAIRWAPEQVDLVREIAATVQQWVTQGEQILDSRHSFEIVAPCPNCGKKDVYRRDELGETVHKSALQVLDTGAECLACRAFWPPELFTHLARILEHN